VKLVSSRENALFKHAKALSHSSRERRKAGMALLEGVHLVSAYIAFHGMPQTLVVSESAQVRGEIAQLLTRAKAADLVVLADALFHEVSTFETPSGILALITPPQPRMVPDDAPACLLLEDIQDPGNVGSILRSAAASGVRHVLLSRGCAFAWSPKVLRAGQGAHFLLNIVEEADLEFFLRGFAGQSLALTPHAGQTIYDIDMKPSTALLIGNEGAGLSALLLQAADQRVAIPMPGKTESINAAAAAAVCLFEMARQRRSTGEG
jgi:RNA methyltransferase, TrmH family